jgi:hypothetical protein
MDKKFYERAEQSKYLATTLTKSKFYSRRN